MYRVINGISYYVNKVQVYRAAGSMVDDLPPGLAQVFLEDHAIEKVEPAKAAVKKAR